GLIFFSPSQKDSPTYTTQQLVANAQAHTISDLAFYNGDQGELVFKDADGIYTRSVLPSDTDGRRQVLSQLASAGYTPEQRSDNLYLGFALAALGLVVLLGALTLNLD